MVLLKEYFEKVYLEKNQQITKKKACKPWITIYTLFGVLFKQETGLVSMKYYINFLHVG